MPKYRVTIQRVAEKEAGFVYNQIVDVPAAPPRDTRTDPKPGQVVLIAPGQPIILPCRDPEEEFVRRIVRAVNEA